MGAGACNHPTPESASPGTLAVLAAIADDVVRPAVERFEARAAELSVATLYNLFGSKEGILVALLVSSIESFRQRSPGVTSPAVRGRFDSLSAIAIDEFVSDEFFYRELIKSLSQMESRVHLSGVVGLSLDLGEPIVHRMIAAGELTEVVSPRVLSHHLFLGFVQAVQLWASGVTSSEQFRTQVAHTQCLLLAGVATEGFRVKLHARLRELDEAMLEFSRQQPVSSDMSTDITSFPATHVAQGMHR